MTAAELVAEATRRVCERVANADAAEVYDAIAHAVQIYVSEQEDAANEQPPATPIESCEPLRDEGIRCGHCELCHLEEMTQEEWEAENHPDGPDLDYERAHSAAALNGDAR